MFLWRPRLPGRLPENSKCGLSNRTHRNWFYIYMRLRREATRGLWYHAYNAYMDYGREFKRGKRDERTEPAVQHFLWTNCDLYRVQEEAQTGIIRSFWC